MADERRGGPTTERGDDAGQVGGRTWVVSDGPTDCEHPTDGLRRVGDDGINTYHQCGRCEATIVSQGGLVRAVAIAGGRST